jgi:hypothetical protein
MRSSDGVRHRRVVGRIETQGEAIDTAYCAIFDNADYTAVESPIGATQADDSSGAPLIHKRYLDGFTGRGP